MHADEEKPRLVAMSADDCDVPLRERPALDALDGLIFVSEFLAGLRRIEVCREDTGESFGEVVALLWSDPVGDGEESHCGQVSA